jgi:hypothetical protein
MSNRNLFIMMIILVMIGLMLMSNTVTAQISSTPGSTQPYSGHLTDQLGQSVADGQYDFVFTLYASEKEDQALWSEMQSGLNVKSGNFNVVLGESLRIPKNVTDRKELWLSVSVRGPQDSDFTLLNPRHNLNAPDAVSALSCPHSHFTDSWSGANPEWGLYLENTSVGDGLRAYSKSTVWNYAAVFGANIATTGYGTGVYGYSYNGVGVFANSASGDALEATTESTTKNAIYAHATNANGVWAISTNKQAVHGGSTASYGVWGDSVDNFGVSATGNDSSYYDLFGDLVLGGTRGEIFTFGNMLDLYSNDYVVIDLDNDNNTTNSDFAILNGQDTPVFHVYENGNMTATGTKSAEVKTATYGSRLMYAIESPEVWFEDIGTAYLKDGAVTVKFDPIFAETIDLNIDYHVYVTPICEEAVVLFVTAKTAEGFNVQGVTLNNQSSNCSFDYRVTAKRLGYENTRLAPTDSNDNSKDRR